MLVASEAQETWWTSFHNPQEVICYGSSVCQFESMALGVGAVLDYVPFDKMLVGLG